MKTNWKKIFCSALAFAMLMGMLVACDSNGDELPSPTETTPAPATPTTPSSSSNSASGVTNAKLAAKGTDVYFSETGLWKYCVIYVTYNGYNNPIEERAFSLENPLSTWVTTYEYNQRGKLSKLESKAISNENYAAESVCYSVSFADQDQPTVSFKGSTENMSAKVEYHNNGTIKSWAILSGGSFVEVGVEQDQNGRRTAYREGGETVSYSYAGTSRTPTSVSYEDILFSTPTITLTNTDGQLSAIEVVGGDMQEHCEVTLTHTADGKRPAGIVWRDYQYYSDGYEQHTYEMTYTDTGSYASLSDLCTRVSADYEFSDKDVYTFAYDAQGRLTERTKDIYEDPDEPKWKSEVATLEYDANNRLARNFVRALWASGSLDWSEDIAYVYDANGRIKETSKLRIAYDLFEADTILSKKKTVCEYDENGYESKRTVYTYGNPDNWDEITDTQVY